MLSAVSSLDDYARCINTTRVNFSRIENTLTKSTAVQWDMARFDIIDSELSGNKLFKLLPYLMHAKNRGITQLLSFGGAYSNHLHALAAAGKRFGFSTIGIVRAYAGQEETETMHDLRNWGMQIRFADKSEYALRHDENYLQALQDDYPKALIIPEGGSGMLGVEGSRLMARMLARSLMEPCIVALPMGTGTSFAGLLTAGAISEESTVCGYSALKNADTLKQTIGEIICASLVPVPKWSITDDYCFGGFARMDNALATFMHQFKVDQGIALDPVYTGKLCFAIHQQIEQGLIPAGSRVITIHTGGLQGCRGMLAKTEKKSRIDCLEPC